MAKEEIVEEAESKLSFQSGFKFGLGFFLANLLGVLILGLLVWGFVFLFTQTGIF